MEILIGLLGLACLFGLGMLLSENREAIRWRTIGGAFAFQALIGLTVFYIPQGRTALLKLTLVVENIIDAGRQGIAFLFGGLVSGNVEGLGFIFAFNVLPIIIFFASLIAVLYHIGVMHWVVRLIGGALRAILGTSRAESLSAAANIFVGQTEAPLVVRPFIPRMTPSELFAIMVGGLASVAGSVLAGYAAMGADMRYLLAACFMAAPGGLLYAKLIRPETDEPVNTDTVPDTPEERPVNLFDAAATGAASGMKLALNVGAMLLAFIGLIAVVNLALSTMGAWWFDNEALSMQGILGWLFAPLAWVIGIPWEEAARGGSLIGQKFVLNEFVAFSQYREWMDSFSPRSQAIVTVALCGFANLSSIAILLGGLGGMAPSRRPEIARFGLKAVLAATLANLTSACLAGIFFTASGV